MINLNRVTVAGNLTRDPSFNTVKPGATVSKFCIATNERYTDAHGGTRDETTFVDVEVWGKLAESCHQHLQKGAPALVEGKLRATSWEDKETGGRRTRMFVRAERVQFINGISHGDTKSAA